MIEVRGTFDDALRLCRELGERDGYAVVNSLNPDRLDGQKSVAFEFIDQLGGAPDVVALPFGGGGNVSRVARGFAEAGATPRIVVGEAADRASTWASAIRIGAPAHARRGRRARRRRPRRGRVADDEHATPGERREPRGRLLRARVAPRGSPRSNL